MARTLRLLVASFALLGLARADVKVEEKNQLKIEGVVGSLLSRAAGKAAKEGALQTVAVRGDRKATLGDESGEIVDLAEERIYRLDRRKKTYTVVTFAELRKQREEAERDARAEAPARDGAGRDPREEQVELEVDVKETGERKTLNGFAARQVITTITARKKGRTLEQGGGTVITADAWLTRDVKARDEIAAFDRRYAEKLFGEGELAAAELALVAMSVPGLGDGFAKLREHGAKLEGYPVLTATTVESVQGADEVAAEPAEEAPSDLRSLGGMFAKKLAKKATAKPAGARKPVLALRSEVLSVSTSVGADDVALPAGYTQKK